VKLAALLLALCLTSCVTVKTEAELAAMNAEQVDHELAVTFEKSCDNLYESSFPALEQYLVLCKRRIIELRYPAWSDDVKTIAISGHVSIGMTPDQVRLAWGPFYTINRTTTASGEFDQWAYYARPNYQHYYASPSYVYFERGAVTAVQE
jgi:hypothetical protein